MKTNTMPSSATHDTIALVAAPVVYAGSLLVTSSDQQSAVAITTAFLVSSTMLSPDLDTRSRPYYRWGMIRGIWLPYRWLVPHRSVLSHSFVISSLLRLIYLLLLLSLALVPFGVDLMSMTINGGDVVISIVIGSILADSLHIIADRTVTGAKRTRRYRHARSKRSRIG